MPKRKTIKSKNKIEDVKKTDKYKIVDTMDNIKEVVFPHQVRVGLKDNVFNAKILGSIQKLSDGTTDYIQAGSNVTVTNNNDGSITIASSGGGGSSLTIQDEGSALTTSATTLNFVGTGIAATGTGATKTITVNKATVTNHAQPFWLNASPTGDPTPIYHGRWYDGNLGQFDPEQTSANYVWKYFPYGGEFKKVYGIGDGVGNSSTSNPFTQNAVFAIHKWSDDFITGLSGNAAVRPAIFHVTASPGHTYAEESGTYYHRSTYSFNLGGGTGSPTISSGDLICITFKGEGTQRDGFQRANFFVEWEENIS